MNKKQNKEKLTPGGGHEVAEPAVGYGTQTNVDALKNGPSSRESILASTVSVDEYFDELISLVRKDYTVICGRKSRPQMC